VSKTKTGQVTTELLESKSARTFWSYVDQGGPDECWMWLGARDTDGYGLRCFDGHTTGAHKVAWMLTNGSIPQGLHVLHSCDVRGCVNPAHLHLGTHSQNLTEMWARGRMKRRRNPQTKLTEESVAEIKARYSAGGVTQKLLAAEYGVTQSLISKVVRGAAWQNGTTR
jgi:hypothetical protein